MSGSDVRIALIRSWWVLIACAALLCLAGAEQPDTPDSESAPALPAFDAELVVEGNVVEVIDGDSIVVLLDGQLRKVEILGADTPEWLERRSDPSPESVNAKRFLTRFLLKERVAIRQPEPDATDQLGRLRGYVYRLPDRALVDLEIVRQGYGKVSTRADEPFVDVLRWYERRAKELERGIWGEPEPVTITVPAPTRLVPDSKPGETAPSQPEETESDDGWVWVTKSGSKYHREGCQHLSHTRKKVRRDSVGTTHDACRTCKPDG